MPELQEISDLIVDSEHKTAPTNDGPHPMVRTPNIGRGFLLLREARRVDHETYKKWTRRAVPREGDLILAREAPVGNVAIVPAGVSPILGQRTVLIRPARERVNPRYLQYLLLGDEIQARMAALSSGATVAHLNMADIRALELPALPELALQRKIASVLAAYDELIENNLRRIEILEEMAQAIYREWFVNFRFPGHEGIELADSSIGLVPSEWAVLPIQDAFKVTGGGTPSTKKPEFWDGGTINWYTPSDLTGHGHMFIDRSQRQITEAGLEGSSAQLFPPGCVMMTSRATLGVLAINTVEACTNQGFITCIPNDRVAAPYLFFWLRENAEQIINRASGATFKEISKGVFKQIDFLIPSKETMEHFVRTVDSMLSLLSMLSTQIYNLRSTRDLLLPKLISGEIDVSELDIDTSWLDA